MNKEIVSTDGAPGALGPYNQAVKAGGFVFCSGQIGMDPAGGEVVDGGVTAQTERVLLNLKAVLEAAGSGLDSVVKCTVFLKSMGDFAAMNEVYARYFISEPPARAAVEVSCLPKDVDVEIECIAIA